MQTTRIILHVLNVPILWRKQQVLATASYDWLCALNSMAKLFYSPIYTEMLAPTLK